ncbi:hypothetical protein LOAG_06708 [Loa loa]|uniref:Uncharacterized protein n=1 Tax=Loa loa TaxID=7209 RepID=A0A1S0TXK6_LOALO|nr:hypothetical protein LOAG_06708 [Loa loa]EFO21776.1 hypothetical protein LOAG_06708 [Loa loa]
MVSSLQHTFNLHEFGLTYRRKEHIKPSAPGKRIEAAMLILLTICQGRKRALQLDDLQQEWRLIKRSLLCKHIRTDTRTHAYIHADTHMYKYFPQTCEKGKRGDKSILYLLVVANLMSKVLHELQIRVPKGTRAILSVAKKEISEMRRRTKAVGWIVKVSFPIHDAHKLLLLMNRLPQSRTNATQLIARSPLCKLPELISQKS